MNIEKLLHDHHIPIAQPGDGNYRDGWVNVQCPFCADHSKHLGFNLGQGYAHCWRCGGKFMDQAVAKLLGISKPKARQVMKEYGGAASRQVKEVKRKVRAKAHKYPTDTGPMNHRHKKYLESRGFDPQYIAKTWEVLGTGPIAKLDGIDYKHRILAPIIWNGEEVSWQSRDITGRHKAKYMACPKDRELVEHQTVLYGRPGDWGDTGICVEGITDVWRLGVNSFGTFGIDFTRKQVRAMARYFRRVVVLFDDEPQAQAQAQVLQSELVFRGVEAVIETIEGDPGALSEEDAKDLVKRIF